MDKREEFDNEFIFLVFEIEICTDPLKLIEIANSITDDEGHFTINENMLLSLFIKVKTNTMMMMDMIVNNEITAYEKDENGEEKAAEAFKEAESEKVQEGTVHSIADFTKSRSTPDESSTESEEVQEVSGETEGDE